jgi:hypothetical protein
MRTLRTIIIAAPFALLFGCNGSTPCQEVASTTDNNQGTFSFTEAGVKGSGTIPTSENSVSVQASGSSAFELSGDFVDSAGDCHNFDLTITVDSSSGSMQLGSSSTACIDELPCSSLTGTLDVSSFSANCMGQECALTLVGKLNATTTWKSGTFGLNLSLDHMDSWESYSCNQGGGE